MIKGLRSQVMFWGFEVVGVAINQLRFPILQHRIRCNSRFLVLFKDTYACHKTQGSSPNLQLIPVTTAISAEPRLPAQYRFFLFAAKGWLFLAVHDYLLDKLPSLSDCVNFPDKLHLCKPPPEIIVKGWQCMACGTWQVASVASVSDQGRQNEFCSHKHPKPQQIGFIIACWSVLSDRVLKVYRSRAAKSCSVSAKQEASCSAHPWFPSHFPFEYHKMLG